MDPTTFIGTSLAVDGFGHWLAGFIDGKGTFAVRRHSRTPGCLHDSFAPEFRIKVRSDDRLILNTILARTGIGYVKDVKGSRLSKPQCEWLVTKKEDAKRLRLILTLFPLRAKKERDFELWRQAVNAWDEVKHRPRAGRGSASHPAQIVLAGLKTEIEAIRRFQ